MAPGHNCPGKLNLKQAPETNRCGGPTVVVKVPTVKAAGPSVPLNLHTACTFAVMVVTLRGFAGRGDYVSELRAGRGMEALE